LLPGLIVPEFGCAELEKRRNCQEARVDEVSRSTPAPKKASDQLNPHCAGIYHNLGILLAQMQRHEKQSTLLNGRLNSNPALWLL
jgi:hypothetical protein